MSSRDFPSQREVENKANKTMNQAENEANKAMDQAGDKANELKGRANRAMDQAGDKANDAMDQAGDKANELKNRANRAMDQAGDKASELKGQAKDKAQQAKEQAKDAQETFIEKLREDGVENPAGLAMVGFGGLFLAAIPLTSWIAQPSGLVEKAVNGVCSSVAFLSSAGSNSTVPQTGKIAALGALYVAVTYAFSGAASAAGQASGLKEGRDNNHPRAQVSSLRGLPLRLYSAHYNLMEMFPGFALTAALAQAIAPGDQTMINLLGLHVLSKVFVYYPSYIFNAGTPRTLAHVLATSSVINVALKLSKKPLL